MAWARLAQAAYPALKLLHAIPNGGHRHIGTARALQRQGVRPGIPDLFLPHARAGYHGLYIEMKRRQGGRVEVEQRETIESLRAEGFRVEVCRGWEAGRAVLVEYLT